MTWVELIILVCIAGVLVAPFIRSSSVQKWIRVAALVVLVLVMAFYGLEIVRDLF